MKVDESTHVAGCKLANAKTGCDAVLIKCEVCSKEVDFTGFEKHMQQHKSLTRQVEEEKALYDVVPCEFCETNVPFNKYAQHISEHKSPNAEKNSHQNHYYEPVPKNDVPSSEPAVKVNLPEASDKLPEQSIEASGIGLKYN